MSAHFDYPVALVLAPILAGAVAVLLLLAARRRARRFARLGGATTVGRLVPPAATRSPWVRAALLGTATAFGTVAAAGPRWGTEAATVRGSGADIVLALDASLSMLATDARPNRLEKMRQEARRFLAGSGGDRFALIAFAGRSYILTPLTVDRGALELYLDNLDPFIVGQAGSSLARAIRQGTDLLLTTTAGAGRALVVMSDGEAFEPEEDVVVAARRAGEAGVALVTVGFGTTGGSTIPVQGPGGITEKRDENGEVVVSRYHPELLRASAEAARGAFIEASSTDKATRIRGALSTLRREGRQTVGGLERRPRFQLFLIPAVLLALLDTLLAEQHGRRGPRARRAAVAAAVFFGWAFPVNALADDADEGDRLFRSGRYREAVAAYRRALAEGEPTPRLLYNLGTALLAAGSPEDAVPPLQRAAGAREPDVRYRALFNLGLLHLRRGLGLRGDAAEQAYNEALDAYKRALRIRPDDLDTKWNYELANRARKNSCGGGGGGGGPPPPEPQPPSPQSSQQSPTAIDPRQAAEILSSAAREEREVQGKQQQRNRPDRPPTGKDW